VGASAPKVDERPEAGEGRRNVLQPDRVRADGVAESAGEAGDELVFDRWRAHEVDIVGPAGGVDEGGEDRGEGESGGESGDEGPGTVENDPGNKRGDEGQEKMRLEGAEPQRSAGVEGIAMVEAEKENQAEEREKRGLAHGETDDCGRECNSEPVNPGGRRTVELVKDPNGEEKAGEEDQCPEGAGDAKTEQAEGVSERKCPRRVAHDEHGVRVEAGSVLNGPDGVTVVRIEVVDELMTSGPIRKVVSTGSQLACKRASKDVKNGDCEGEASRGGDGNLSEVAAGACWRRIQLRDHGGYFTRYSGVSGGNGD